MFFDNQPLDQQQRYIRLLQQVGALSGLFADSNVPYLYYRAAEIIFCKAFEAMNHTRSDIAIDASKNDIGVGLKTYLNKTGNSFQKIAEFNKNRKDYQDFQLSEDKIRVVSDLRNARLDVVKRLHQVNSMVYHCVVRREGQFLLFDELMPYVNVDNIVITKIGNNTIHFHDSVAEYNFNLSKSTLFKRFTTPNNAISFDVKILPDPFEFLEQLQVEESASYIPTIILPLYSFKKLIGKYVPEKSGLNHWNAGGRPRQSREVYIPIPIWIHQKFPDFFPPRDHPFNLQLPDGGVLNAKVCQDNSKALMSNPNTALGDWLLGKVLAVLPNTLVDYQMLQNIGIDSVEIRKLEPDTYAINFKAIGTYDSFSKQYNL